MGMYVWSRESVWSGACTWVCPYVQVCVCMSKRARLSCIHMGMCVCVHACTGGFTWEWGGLALEA